MKPFILKLTLAAVALGLCAAAPAAARAQQRPIAVTARPGGAAAINQQAALALAARPNVLIAVTARPGLGGPRVAIPIRPLPSPGPGGPILPLASAFSGGSFSAAVRRDSPFAGTTAAAVALPGSAAGVSPNFPPVSLGFAMGLTADQIVHDNFWSQFFGVKGNNAATRRTFPPVSLGFAMGLTADQIVHDNFWSQFFGVKGAAAQAAAYNGYVPASFIKR